MHPWRQEELQTLKHAATIARGSPDWTDYAEFCLEYERGFRKKSLAKLERFLLHMERAPFEQRRIFVSWLLTFAESRKGKDMLVPNSLKLRLIEPTLLEWTLVDETCSEPHQWIGGLEHLGIAFQLNARDPKTRSKLVLYLLSQVEFSMRELPKGYEELAIEGLAHLNRAEALILDLPNEDDRIAYAADIAEERRAIDQYLNLP